MLLSDTCESSRSFDLEPDLHISSILDMVIILCSAASSLLVGPPVLLRVRPGCDPAPTRSSAADLVARIAPADGGRRGGRALLSQECLKPRPPGDPGAPLSPA
mmetsp:Transcript_17538/g.52773  ORF Transcript_17538/g.52773 Transcript_17538/m.52773 type:complete len:103 (-) Transcript_17538:4-312(-)